MAEDAVGFAAVAPESAGAATAASAGAAVARPEAEEADAGLTAARLGRCMTAVGTCLPSGDTTELTGVRDRDGSCSVAAGLNRGVEPPDPEESERGRGDLRVAGDSSAATPADGAAD